MSENDTCTGDSELLKGAVIDANDALAKALHWANKSADKGDMRPSTKMAFDEVQNAHTLLSQVDPTRVNDPEDSL